MSIQSLRKGLRSQLLHAGLNLAYSEIGTVKKQFFFWNRGQVKKKKLFTLLYIFRQELNIVE